MISGSSAVFLFVFLMTYIVGSEMMAANSSYATEFAAAVNNAGGDTISLTSSQRLSTEVTASTDGTAMVVMDNLNVKSTASTGYAIYLSVDNNRENGNRMYLDGSNTSNEYINPPPNSATWEEPQNLTANTWGYALENEGGFDDYYTTGTISSTSYKFAAVPLRGSEQRIATSNTYTPEDGDNYDIYYGVDVNTLLPAGTYVAKVIYTATTSTGLQDTASVSPSTVTSLSGGDEISITTSLMANASGVGAVTVIVGDADCTNVRIFNTEGGNLAVKCYTPAKATGTYDIRVSIPSYSKNYFISNALTYAAPETTLFGISYMQDMTPAICSSVPTPAAGATETSTSLERIRGSVNVNTGKASLVAEAVLIDNRDNKQYIVRKMPDGNCWMSQNLDLDLTVKDSNGEFATAAEGKTGQVYAKKLNSTDTTLLTKDNTDISGESWAISSDSNNIGYATQAPSEKGSSWTWEQYGRNKNATAGETQNSSYEVRSYDPGNECRKNNGSSSSMGSDAVITPCTQPSTTHVGNYYNWPAVTAGSGTYSVGTQYANVNDSICPKNWDLPTGSQGDSVAGQWNVLLKNVPGITVTGGVDTYNTMTAPIMWAITNEPYSLVRVGYYDIASGSMNSQGPGGNYWTSTADRSDYAYYLTLNSNSVYPGTRNRYKGYGRSVRCIASSSYDYSLSYNLNGGSITTTELNAKTGVTDNGATTTITIPKIEPQKENQVFLGWAESEEDASEYKVTHRLYDDSENHDGTGSNKITLTASSPNKTLYAVWADDMTVTDNIEKCRDGEESTVDEVYDYIMADPRDKKLYVTRKLKDGQCWMSQNLDLDIAIDSNSPEGSSVMGTISLVTNDFVKFTDGNTNLQSDTTEWTITGPNAGYATQTSTGITWNRYGSNNADQSTGDDTYEVRSYDIDKGGPNKACYTNGTTARACTTPVGAADVTRAGNYYNWPAATAGTGTYSVSSGNATGSICPAGWQLPYGNNGTGTNGGNTAKGFYYLLNDVAATSEPKDAPLLANPYSYVRAGYYNADGYMSGQGSGGLYWPRMASSQNRAYHLGFSSSYVRPGTDDYFKGIGVSVRCVAQ